MLCKCISCIAFWIQIALCIWNAICSVFMKSALYRTFCPFQNMCLHDFQIRCLPCWCLDAQRAKRQLFMCCSLMWALLTDFLIWAYMRGAVARNEVQTWSSGPNAGSLWGASCIALHPCLATNQFCHGRSVSDCMTAVYVRWSPVPSRLRHTLFAGSAIWLFRHNEGLLPIRSLTRLT